MGWVATHTSRPFFVSLLSQVLSILAVLPSHSFTAFNPPSSSHRFPPPLPLFTYSIHHRTYQLKSHSHHDLS
ncbi:Autophagy-related protein 8 [Fusarium oxysporum f. sp. albedinis]|nr:Autophagy-related protein 8 [Fusarium oxysporum f. sp. albedinis]